MPASDDGAGGIRSAVRVPARPASEQQMRVAYLTSLYPAVSHAFIEREIEGLRELGHEIRTVSVRPAPAESLLTETMRSESEQTTALLADRAGLLREAIAFAVRHPRVLAGAVRRALRTGVASPRHRLWQLFYLVEAIGLIALMRTDDLRHVHVHFSNVAADVARHAVALGRHLDGDEAGWLWTMSLHGPTEFEEVTGFDLPAKLTDAAAVACISDFARSQAMRLVPQERWHRLDVVHMSVDTERYAPGPERAASDPRHLLFVGRLVAEKGPTVLLDAVSLLRERWDVELTYVGAGPLERDLRRRAARLGLEHVVRFAGARGQDDLPEIYGRADVFCLPSFQEGLPVVLMEAMASGVPVVSTRIAGIPELVTPQTGRLVSPGRPDQLAQAIEALLANPSLAGELADAGRARVCDEFSSATTAPRMASFLASATSLSRSR